MFVEGNKREIENESSQHKEGGNQVEDVRWVYDRSYDQVDGAQQHYDGYYYRTLQIYTLYCSQTRKCIYSIL